MATIKQRPKTRELIRWDNDKDIKLLLTIHSFSIIKGIKLPWDEIGAKIGPSVTGNAVQQHLAKLRKKLEKSNPDLVPDFSGTPRAPRSKNSEAPSPGAPTTGGKAPSAKKNFLKYSTTPDDDGLDPDSADPDGEYGERKPSKREAKSKRLAIKEEDSDSEFETSPSKKQKGRGGKVAVLKQEPSSEKKMKQNKYSGKTLPGAEDSNDELDDDQYVAANSKLLDYQYTTVKNDPGDSGSEQESDSTTVKPGSPTVKTESRNSRITTFGMSPEKLYEVLKRPYTPREEHEELNLSAMPGYASGGHSSGLKNSEYTPMTPTRGNLDRQNNQYGFGSTQDMATFSGGLNPAMINNAYRGLSFNGGQAMMSPILHSPSNSVPYPYLNSPRMGNGGSYGNMHMMSGAYNNGMASSPLQNEFDVPGSGPYNSYVQHLPQSQSGLEDPQAGGNGHRVGNQVRNIDYFDNNEHGFLDIKKNNSHTENNTTPSTASEETFDKGLFNGMGKPIEPQSSFDNEFPMFKSSDSPDFDVSPFFAD